MRMRWTDREINLIRAGFIAGKPIKIISREVGRSPSAVNKFLSRAGIRKRRWTISKPKRYFESGKPLPNPKPIVDQSQKYEIIFDLNDVIQFLSANGYTISKNDKKAFSPLEDYAINNKPASDVKLLLLANKLRCEQHLPIFNVPSLMF